MTVSVSTIILIGPVRCGKRTLGRLLAERLGVSNASLDDDYERDVQQLDSVAALLAPHDDVVLLLPSPDPDQSEALLRERLTFPMHIALNPLFVRHGSNARLAKWVAYTHGKEPAQTRDEILAHIGSRGGARDPRTSRRVKLPT